MRNLKKVLSLVLAMVMVLSMMVTANAAFADADEISYTEAVEVMNAIGILQGDGTNFNPAGTLTRAEAAVILAKAASGKSAVSYFEAQTKYSENPFTDVSGWAVPYVLYCYDKGITGGTSADTYSPKKSLTGYEFAKMLLVAAGYGVHADYVGDATQTWQQKVVAKAKSVGLLAGLDIALKNPIAREQAAQMALNAMMAGGKSTTTYYVVAAGDTTAANTVPTAYLNKTDDAMEAYFMATIMGTSVAKVHQVTKVSGGLLADKFGVTYTVNTVDTFGRPSVSYTIPAAITGTVAKTMYYGETALATYTTATLPATVAADLAGYTISDYTVNWDTTQLACTFSVPVVEDGASYSQSNYGYNFATLVYLLSDDNQSLEIYGDPVTKTISKIVIVNNYVDEIDVVTEAVALTNTPSYATITAGTFVNAGYKVGDVVSYNVDATGVVNVAPATGAFEGVASSYTNTGYGKVYTINGANYYLYDADSAALVEAYLPYGETLVYYPGAAGTILYVDTIDEVQVVINDYALVLDTYVKATSTTGIAGTTSTYAAELKVLLSNGKCEIWELPLVKSGANWYYVLNGAYNLMTYTTAEGTLAGLENQVYTYVDKSLVANVATSLPAGVSGTVVEVVNADFNYLTNYKVGANAYVNENTTFIMQANNFATTGAYTTKTGLKSLSENLTGTMFVVKTMTWNKIANAHIETASVVFAANDRAAGVASTATVVYNTGIYTVSYDAAYRPVYTYTVVDAAGNYSTAKGDGTNAAGLWTLKADGSLDANTGATCYTIVAINGSVVEVTDGVSNTYFILGSTTAAHSLVAKTVQVGASIYVVDALADKVADIIYVVG